MKTILITLLIWPACCLSGLASELHAVQAMNRITILNQEGVFYWYNSYGQNVYIRQLQSGFFPPVQDPFGNALAQSQIETDFSLFESGYCLMSVRMPVALGYDKLFMDTGTDSHGNTSTLPGYFALPPGQYISIDISPYYPAQLPEFQAELVIWFTFEP